VCQTRLLQLLWQINFIRDSQPVPNISEL
jgi:hypothetical protein